MNISLQLYICRSHNDLSCYVAYEYFMLLQTEHEIYTDTKYIQSIQDKEELSFKYFQKQLFTI